MGLVIRTDGGQTRSGDIAKASRIDSCIYQGNERALESKCHHFQWQQVDKNSLCLWQNSALSDFFFNPRTGEGVASNTCLCVLVMVYYSVSL